MAVPSFTIGETVPLCFSVLGGISMTLLSPSSAIHKLAAPLDHAGDEAPQTTANDASTLIKQLHKLARRGD
jgi:hypothetical protein